MYNPTIMTEINKLINLFNCDNSLSGEHSNIIIVWNTVLHYHSVEHSNIIIVWNKVLHYHNVEHSLTLS